MGWRTSKRKVLFATASFKIEGWGYFQEITELGYEFDIVWSHLWTTFRDVIKVAAVSLFSWPWSLSPWIELRSAPIQLQDLVLLPLSIDMNKTWTSYSQDTWLYHEWSMHWGACYMRTGYFWRWPLCQTVAWSENVLLASQISTTTYYVTTKHDTFVEY